MKHNVVYVSPESILQDSKWRNMLRTSAYEENVIALAVDEAHCIGNNSLPFISFRYGCVPLQVE